MSNYFLHDGSNQTGPFGLDELKLQNIKKDTPVWKEGMTDWVKAGELPELSAFFHSTPPPFQSVNTVVTHSMQPVPARQNSNSKFLIILIIALGVGGYFFWKSKNDSSYRSGDSRSIEINSGDQRGSYSDKTEEDLKEDLAQKEQDSPAKYLVVKDATFRKNLIGEMVLEGRIKNTATIAGFKDMVLEASFRTPSGTILATRKFTRYEKLGPGYDVTFKFKTNVPKEVDAVSINVVNATPLQ